MCSSSVMDQPATGDHRFEHRGLDATFFMTEGSLAIIATLFEQAAPTDEVLLRHISAAQAGVDRLRDLVEPGVDYGDLLGCCVTQNILLRDITVEDWATAPG